MGIRALNLGGTAFIFRMAMTLKRLSIPRDMQGQLEPMGPQRQHWFLSSWGGVRMQVQVSDESKEQLNALNAENKYMSKSQ